MESLASRKFLRTQLRKPPVRNDIRTIEEIIDDGLRSGFVLHSDQDQPRNAVTTKDRLRLLKLYADIAIAPGAAIFEAEFEKSVDWYRTSRFPAFLGKDFRRGDLTRRVEVVFPILLSAKSLRGILRLYEFWKAENASGLRNLLVEPGQTQQSVASVIEQVTDPLEKQVLKNRQRHALLIEYLIQRKLTIKYRRNVRGDQVGQFTSSAVIMQKGKAMHFRDAECAWYTDYAVFCSLQIEPFFYQENTTLSDAQILAFAKDQLLKAAHIMLRGVQPTVVADTESRPRFKYCPRCDWHLIATSFAELLTNQALELRLCEVCGKDISDLIPRAIKCRDCAEKKRKRKTASRSPRKN